MLPIVNKLPIRAKALADGIPLPVRKKIGAGCTAVLTAKFQEAEAREVKRAAERHGITVSAYLRKLALAAVATTEAERA